MYHVDRFGRNIGRAAAPLAYFPGYLWAAVQFVTASGSVGVGHVVLLKAELVSRVVDGGLWSLELGSSLPFQSCLLYHRAFW